MTELVIPSKNTLTELSNSMYSDHEKYDDALWAYHDAFYPIRKLYLRRLSSLLRILPDSRRLRIVEIGSGSGILMTSLKTLSDFVIGTDLHRELGVLRRIMKRQGVDLDLVRCDARHLPFANESVDMFVGASVMEHLPKEDLRTAVHEIHQALRFEGHLALGYPIENFLVRFFFNRIGFDFRRHHPSRGEDIRKSVRDIFGKLRKVERLCILPRLLAFYEVMLANKE